MDWIQKIAHLCLFFLLGQAVHAQYQIGMVPRVSPDRLVYQKVGYTEVEIAYGSPAVKGRDIFGDLVPYDKVWRAGANNATRVTFSSKAQFREGVLDSGTYACFLVPKEEGAWTIIFNREHKQWGAFKYDSNKDALKIEVVPTIQKELTEQLTYSIQQTGYQKGYIMFNWEYIELEIPFETTYLEEFIQEVESRAAQQPGYLRWVVFIQGAEHLETLNADSSIAMSWIRQAETLMDTTSEWNDQFYPRDYVKGHLYWIKAKLYARKKEFSKALSLVEQLKSLEKPFYYRRKNETEGIDRAGKKWKERQGMK
ncbi:MAG: DUF2911 domain-containing protein [Bacteroidota bacterium]